MPLQPAVTGDQVMDQWSEEVTYELNNVLVAAAALAGASGGLADNQVITPVYATDSMGTDQSLILGSRQFVYFVTHEVGTPPSLPLTGVEFIRFRGEDTRTVEIVIKTIPTSLRNARGETRDYTNFNALAVDWSVGAIEPETFPDDPDGLDFSFRTTAKMLMARVMKASNTVNPADAYEDPTLARSFDYSWTRNGETFTPSLTGVTTDFPFIFLQASDVIDADPMDPGISSQFFCNVVQL